jgi:hypothetical protein
MSVSIQDRVIVCAIDVVDGWQVALSIEADGNVAQVAALHWGHNGEDGSVIDQFQVIGAPHSSHEWLNAGENSDGVPLDYRLCERCRLSSESDYPADCTGVPVRLEVMAPDFSDSDVDAFFLDETTPCVLA